VATVADQVISALRISGVRRVYGLPGDSLNGFTDALRRSGEITWEHVRHEETAGFAAAADAALTGQLAVCAGSCGPGNLHLINGLFDAQRSRVPVLAIAAHIPRTEIGSEYFQETHPQELFRECSVYRELVSTPEMAPEAPIVEETSEGVRLMTVHRAKGLEFPVVILADVTANMTAQRPSRHVDPERGLCALGLAGWLPLDLLDHQDAELARERAEGVRVAYVAATRARDLLVVPAVGDDPFAIDRELATSAWVAPVQQALYPAAHARRGSRPAPGCPRRALCRHRRRAADLYRRDSCRD